ncbi:MAG: hypothetical protein ABI231_11265 [Candidatus Tumulicola sp.]
MQLTLRTVRGLAGAAAALALYACNANADFHASPGLPNVNSPSVIGQGQRIHRSASGGKIQHVIIIVQENRSFNNLFYGYPGAKTAQYGHDFYGNKIKLLPVGLET